jgi:hypothetical protein
MEAGTTFRVILLITYLGLHVGCIKNSEGCVDPLAKTTCQGCNQANEVCEYTGTGVFWYPFYAGHSLEAPGTHSLSYYIDGQLTGTTQSITAFWRPHFLLYQ